MRRATRSRTAASPCSCRSSHGSCPFGLDGDEGLPDEPLVLGEGLHRRRLPRRVAVEGVDDLAAELVLVHQQPAQHADVLAAERRAARGDGRGDPGEVAGHDVGVALDDDGLVPLGDVPLGPLDAVEHGALLVERGLRGVEVLRPRVVVHQLAGAEADDVAGDVADRPHQPAVETVDQRAARGLLGQAAGDQLGLGEALAAQVPGQRVPAAGREAAAEVDGHLAVEAALGEELPGRRGLGRAELLGEERGGRGVGRDQPGPLADVGPVGRAGGAAAVVLVVQLDVGPAGEQLDRLGEGEVVDLLDERNDIASFSATKTMVEISRRSDLERRRFLVVERAQPLQAAAAGALELQVLADDLVDLRPLAHERDVRRPDASPAGHQLLPPMTAAPVAAPTAAVLRRLSTSSSQSRNTCWCSGQRVVAGRASAGATSRRSCRSRRPAGPR